MKARTSPASQVLKLSSNLEALEDPWRLLEFQVIAVTIIFKLQLESNYFLPCGSQASLRLLSLTFSLRYCYQSAELQPKITPALLWENVTVCLVHSMPPGEHKPILLKLHQLSVHDSRAELHIKTWSLEVQMPSQRGDQLGQHSKLSVPTYGRRKLVSHD